MIIYTVIQLLSRVTEVKHDNHLKTLKELLKKKKHWDILNPFKLNRISYSYKLDHCISVLRFFIFIQIVIEHSVRKHGDPDQTLYSVAFDQGLHC